MEDRHTRPLRRRLGGYTGNRRGGSDNLGGDERCFEQDGKVYKHILDPKTGHPAESGLASATAIGDEGRYCDALSTSIYVPGAEGAAFLWRERGDFDMVLICEDGSFVITEGIEQSFELTMPAKLKVLRK